MDTTDLPPVTPLITTPEADQCPHCSHRWHGLPCRTSFGYMSAGSSKCPCPTAWEEPA